MDVHNVVFVMNNIFDALICKEGYCFIGGVEFFCEVDKVGHADLGYAPCQFLALIGPLRSRSHSGFDISFLSILINA